MMKFVPLKIVDADGTSRYVLHITNDVDDIGNAIAEKRLDESQRFIVLAEAYRKRFVRAEEELFDVRQKIEADRYAQGWVARWLDETTKAHGRPNFTGAYCARI